MRLLSIIFTLILLIGCDSEEEVYQYTGNVTVYELQKASDFPISGTATIKERRDGQVEIFIQLEGTDGNIEHPTHLHYGNISTPDAEVALVLNPVLGTTGKSATRFTALKDETPITYTELLEFDGHIKVHLDGGANKSTILAAGNVGSAAKVKTTGRVEIAVCKSE
jgi:hypothetical protein